MRHLLLVLALSTSVSAGPRTAADVSNALVPKALAKTIHFELRTVEAGGKLTVAAPAGWKDTGNGNLERQDEPEHHGPPYFPAAMTVRGEACAGDWTGEACTDAPAEKQVEALFHGFEKDQVLAKSSTPTERYLEAKEKFATYVVRAWWKPGASRFTYCAATLTAPLAPARAAFAAACKAVTPG